MKYSVLQKSLEYENCKIYIRNTKEVWEYFCIINGELYTAYIVARKKPLNKLLGMPYTAKEVQSITQYMIAMAQTTIDTVLEIKHEPEKT